MTYFFVFFFGLGQPLFFFLKDLLSLGSPGDPSATTSIESTATIINHDINLYNVANPIINFNKPSS